MQPVTSSAEPRPDPLPEGTRVTFLLVEGVPEYKYELTHHLRGRRAVSGEVVGYAVRDRTAVDVQIRSVLTWLPGSPPTERESLPPEFQLTVRVRVELTLARTFELLTRPATGGRAILCVTEIPWGRCWKCQAPAGKGIRHCTQCGSMVGVGSIPARPARSPLSFESACRGCWHPLEGEGGYCPFCGHARVLDALQERLEERRVAVRLQWVGEGRRGGRFRASLLGLRSERLYAEGGEQLIATVGDLQADGDIPRGLELPDPAFVTEVVVQADEGRLVPTAQALLRGERVRVSEFKRPCPRCAQEVEDRSRFVAGLHCTRCGTRVRLQAHPSFQKLRPGRRPQFESAHACGAIYRVGRDLFCGTCGESTGAGEREEERFSFLG